MTTRWSSSALPKYGSHSLTPCYTPVKSPITQSSNLAMRNEITSSLSSPNLACQRGIPFSSSKQKKSNNIPFMLLIKGWVTLPCPVGTYRVQFMLHASLNEGWINEFSTGFNQGQSALSFIIPWEPEFGRSWIRGDGLILFGHSGMVSCMLWW